MPFTPRNSTCSLLRLLPEAMNRNGRPSKALSGSRSPMGNAIPKPKVLSLGSVLAGVEVLYELLVSWLPVLS